MAEADSFDVVILGFDQRDEAPEARLQQAFGVDGDTAERILMELPATVQRAVSRVRAEYFRRALLRIGAAVEVRDPAGVVMAFVPSPSFPPPASAPPPATPVPATRPAPAPDPGWAPADPGWSAAGGRLDEQPSGSTMPEVSNQGALQQAGVGGAWGGLVTSDPVANGAGRQVPAATAGPVFPALEWPAPDGPIQPGSSGLLGGANSGLDSSFSAGAGVGLPTGGAPLISAPSLDQLRGGGAQAWGQRVAPAWEVDAVVPAAAPAPLELRADLPLPQLDPTAVDAVTAPRERSDVWDPPPAPARPRVEGAAATVRMSQSPAAEAAPRPARAAQPRPARAAQREPPGPAPRTRQRAGADSLPRPPTTSDGPAPFALPQRAAHRVREVNPRPAPLAAPERTPPPAPAPAPPPEGASADGASFWESIGDGCLLPLRGPGLYWIFAIGAFSVAVSILSMLASFVPLIGALVTFFANTCLLAFTCDYYRVCMWVPASHEHAIDRSPDFDPARLMNNYIKSGIHLSLFTIASQLLVIAYFGYAIASEGFSPEVLIDLATSPLTWLLVLFPLYYWTMGVGLTALHHNFASVWNVPAGLRAIARAPLEYSAIVALGMLVFGVSFGGLVLFGAGLGLTGSLLGGTVGVPLALSHGVQGALMGHLLRARPEVFEQ